jgi:protein required for attachment to host cells
MKSSRIWVLVADGARARFLRYEGRKQGAVTIDDQVFSAKVEPSRKIGSDRPGRTFDSKGSGRHAIEPRIDLHEEKERQFLADVVRKLEEAFHGNAFDEVLIIAPPKALGVIRTLMSDRLRTGVKGEIDGDYTRYDDQNISRLVTETLFGGAKLHA